MPTLTPEAVTALADRDLPWIRGTLKVGTREPAADTDWWRLHAEPGHVGPMFLCEPECRAAAWSYW
jgi:hypothetical protein